MPETRKLPAQAGHLGLDQQLPAEAAGGHLLPGEPANDIGALRQSRIPGPCSLRLAILSGKLYLVVLTPQHVSATGFVTFLRMMR